jgi:putative ABC transport system permease protein
MSLYSRVEATVVRSWATAFISFRALRRNKLRSGLTALGIIIGVASVVAMVAVGNGAQQSIERQVASLGQNLLMVFAGSSKMGGVNSGLGTRSTITLADTAAIGRDVTDALHVSPEDTASAQVVANGRNWLTTIAGEAPEYLLIRDWKLDSGTMFSERDVRAAAKVAVIGSKVAFELFGPLDPIGQSIRIRNIPFVIVGLLASKGAGMGGQNQDDRIIIPYTTAMKRITGDRYLRSVNVEVVSAERMDVAQQQITSLLRQRHRITADRDDDFNIFNQKEIADTASSITTVITLLLGAIAGISLLVGGIGIMNIMLVSVTERTREIGIRIAVGAQPSAIKLQFLIEAMTLSVFGGLIGVLLGVGISMLVGAFASFKPIVSVGSILLAFFVSFTIGVFFGLYPAQKAAALDPIDALRYE